MASSSSQTPSPVPSNQCSCQGPNSASCPASTTNSRPGGNSVVLSSGAFNFDLPLLSTPAVGQGGWNFSLSYLSNNNVNDIAGIGFNYS